MVKRILKVREDLNKFEQEVGYSNYKTPEEYPCLAISSIKNCEVRWSIDGFKISYNHDIDFIYPRKIQKELYEDDFDDMVKKP